MGAADRVLPASDTSGESSRDNSEQPGYRHVQGTNSEVVVSKRKLAALHVLGLSLADAHAKGIDITKGYELSDENSMSSKPDEICEDERNTVECIGMLFGDIIFD